MSQSVEPNIADLANGWLKSYKLPYKLEQESLNAEIDKALSDYFTKNGGTGANRPDAKILLQDKNLNFYPILIEYKGYKNSLVKLDANHQVENRTTKNEPHFKNINSFAVNGAVHYANALLHHTSYTDIIAIGMTGYKDEAGKLQHKIGVYFVSKSNRFVPHFHIPLQSGSDEILKKMKRRYLSNLYLDRVTKIREVMPNACIGVDVIVGFPGETEELFMETYNFLNELPISYLHVFTYSERDNTEAIEFEGVVDQGERKRRNKMLRILSEKKRQAFYQSQLNSTQKVLWEHDNKDGKMFGFTEDRKSVV